MISDPHFGEPDRGQVFYRNGQESRLKSPKLTSGISDFRNVTGSPGALPSFLTLRNCHYLPTEDTADTALFGSGLWDVAVVDMLSLSLNCSAHSARPS